MSAGNNTMGQINRAGWGSPPTGFLPHRRDLLKVGAMSVGGSLLPAWAAADQPQRGPVRSVIYLWMGGGVTHIDSFDPKPQAPQEIRGTLSAIDTNVPGIRFCETLPCLAEVADKLAVLRSFSHDSNDHLLSQAYTLSGRKVTMQQLTTEPNIGSVVAYLLGPRNDLPAYLAVPGITRPGPPPWNLFVGGWLGDEYAPFALGGLPEEPDFTKTPKSSDPNPYIDEDLTPQALRLPEEMDIDRLAARAQLHRQLDAALSRLDGSRLSGAVEGHYQNALRLLASPRIRQAFDLSAEGDSTRERYGRTKIGGRCLMARRLVEAGARFVMVDYGYDHDYGNLWDNHNAASQNMPHVSELVQRPYHVRGIDRAFAGLIRDLDERGLLDSTLVVFLTEFGRTPKINARGGRDHWGAAGSLFFAGGGVRGGQVIGATDAQEAAVVTRPYSPADVAATIYHCLGIDLEERLYDRQRRPHPVLPAGQCIDELFS